LCPFVPVGGHVVGLSPDHKQQKGTPSEADFICGRTAAKKLEIDCKHYFYAAIAANIRVFALL
jgi:hypothetical protein